MSKIKMPKSIRTKWLKALRSGRYKQVTGDLYLDEGKNGKNCCLGVLGRCLLIPKDVLLTGAMPDTIDDFDNKYIKKFPKCIVRKGKDRYNSTSFASALAGLNDDGKNFQEIADYIEKRTKGA